MKTDLSNLKPEGLWKNFEKLTEIPRPSKKEEKITLFMKEFGENLGLDTTVDSVGNVIIKKPATPGMEDRKGIILQGHIDMVPQANSDKDFNFETDPIEAFVDGEWVTANGTTLGADNGMGVAATMAILESKDIPHGQIEALFTVDEETGMTGAFALKAGMLDGDILLNMDSEEEGELFIGCAGGINSNTKFTFTETPVPANSLPYKISVSGLKGGHSGLDIPLYRGNANKILIRLLKRAAKEYGLRIADIQGGSLRNAIPREAYVIVTISKGNEDGFLKYLKDFEKTVKQEYASVDPDLKISAESAPLPKFLIDETTQKNLINAIYACPNGIIRMSNDMKGLVETSTNLAIIESKNDEIFIQCLLRSSVDSAKEDLAEMFDSLFELAGATTKFDGDYPGWKPNPDSAILKEMLIVYKNKFGKTPAITAIHAGLECGLLGGVYPNWDMISFGPTIRSPHSPDEKVNIESVQKFWDFLLETLKHVPKK